MIELAILMALTLIVIMGYALRYAELVFISLTPVPFAVLLVALLLVAVVLVYLVYREVWV